MHACLSVKGWPLSCAIIGPQARLHDEDIEPRSGWGITQVLSPLIGSLGERTRTLYAARAALRYL